MCPKPSGQAFRPPEFDGDDDEAKGQSQLQVLGSRRDNKQEVKKRSLFAVDVDDDDDGHVDEFVLIFYAIIEFG